MWDTVGLYWRLVGAQLRGKLQYRASMIMEAIAQFLITFLDFAGVAVLFNRFPTLQGWSIYEIAVLYGTSAISFSLAQLSTRGFEQFDRYIQLGELDRVLIRPLNPFVQVLAAELALHRLGRLGQGAIVLALGLGGAAIAWDGSRLLLLAATLLAGTGIFVAIFVLGAVATFWTVTTTEFTNIFTHGGTTLSSYPLTIYGHWFRDFFLFIIPLGFVNFLPLRIILDKPEPASLPLWLGWLALPAAGVFFALALGAWHWGLRKYQGTGS